MGTILEFIFLFSILITQNQLVIIGSINSPLRTQVYYQIRNLNAILKEFQDCSIHIKVYQFNSVFRIEFGPIEVPITLASDKIDKMKSKYTFRSRRRTKRSPCWVNFFIEMNMNNYPRKSVSSTFSMRSYLNSGLNLFEENGHFFEPYSYVVLFYFRNSEQQQANSNLPNIREINNPTLERKLRKYVIFSTFQIQANKNMSAADLEFQVTGARLTWELEYTEIPSSHPNSSNYQFSFGQIEIGMTKLRNLTKNGKVFEKRVLNETNSVQACLPWIKNPFRTFDPKIEFKDVMAALLLKEIERYGLPEPPPCAKVITSLMPLVCTEENELRTQGCVRTREQVNIESYSLNFVTCQRTRTEGVNLDKYLTPFQPNTWYTLTLAILVIPAVLCIIYFWTIPARERRTKDFIYNIFAISFGYLLEIPPDALNQIQINPTLKFTFRILIGLWSLMGVFITAVYRNEIIVEGLAPIPVTGNLTRLAQAKQFRFWAHGRLLEELVQTQNLFTKYTKPQLAAMSNCSLYFVGGGNYNISNECFNRMKTTNAYVMEFGMTLEEFNSPQWSLVTRVIS